MKYLITAFPYFVIVGGAFIAIRQQASYKGNRIDGEQAIWFGLFFVGLGLLMMWREFVRKKKLAQTGEQTGESLDH